MLHSLPYSTATLPVVSLSSSGRAAFLATLTLMLEGELQVDLQALLRAVAERGGVDALLLGDGWQAVHRSQHSIAEHSRVQHHLYSARCDSASSQLSVCRWLCVHDSVSFTFLATVCLRHPSARPHTASHSTILVIDFTRNSNFSVDTTIIQIEARVRVMQRRQVQNRLCRTFTAPVPRGASTL